MAVFRYYRCPDCGETYRHFHTSRDEPPPDFCSWDTKLNAGRGGCGAALADNDPVFVPQAPGIRKSPYVKSMDQTYRAMEAASIERAREAADMAGVSEAEMAHLKITNMKDPSSVREGESSAITTPPPKDIFGNGSGGFNPLALPGGQMIPGPLLAQAVAQGDAPRVGTSTQSQITSSHTDRAWAMQQRGQLRPTYHPKR